MSDEKDDGGPAFPLPDTYVPDEHRGCVNGQYGMSLRDYFAAAALTGICVSDKFVWTTGNTQDRAMWAYEIADAMLAARKAKP